MVQKVLSATLPQMCDAANVSAKRPAIYMSMGPSGAGKDTLLLGARDKLLQDGDDSVEFVKRYITRDAQKVTDLEIPVSLEEFQAASARGDYAIEYHANNCHYAITHSAIEAGIIGCRRMVLNVSRTVIDQVRADYQEKRGIDVYCLNITASDSELKKRLTGRGRESDEEIAERIRRGKLLEPKGHHVINIVNEASMEEGVDLTVKALTGSMKYSLWFVPSQASLINTVSSKEITDLASRFGMWPFEPHVTAGKSFTCSQLSAINIAQAAAHAVGAPVTATPLHVSASGSLFFRAVVLEIMPTPEICDASAVVRRTAPFDHDRSFHAISEDVRTAFAPHVSFLYGKHDTETLEAARKSVESALSSPPCLSSGFSLDELVLVMTSGTAYHCWTEVARFPLLRSADASSL